MDWITLVVVVVAVLLVVGVSMLLRRWPVKGKRQLAPEDREALAKLKTQMAEAQAMTDAVRDPRRR